MSKIVNMSGVTTPELIAVHNHCAELLGTKTVRRFENRVTAERRTRYVLSMVSPEKRPAPFTEEAQPNGGMKGSVRAEDAPHPMIKSITSVSGPAVIHKSQGSTFKNTLKEEASSPGMGPAVTIRSEAVRTLQDALETTDKSPTPPLAQKTPRWRRPKTTPAGRVAYRPRPGTQQAHAYALLVRPGGVTAEEFCAEMVALGAKPTMTRVEQTWSNLGYLFVTLRGYGLQFDGTTFRLLVPKDERDAGAQGGPA